MVTEGNRLSALKVGVAGHNGVGVLLSLAGDHLYQTDDEIFNIDDLFFEVKLYVERDLVVAAARGVKPLAVVADPLCQLALDEGVDILSLHVYRERAALDISEDSSESLYNILNALLGDNAAFAEHSRVGDTALDILAVHTAVKRDRAVEIICCF